MSRGRPLGVQVWARDQAQRQGWAYVESWTARRKVPVVESQDGPILESRVRGLSLDLGRGLSVFLVQRRSKGFYLGIQKTGAAHGRLALEDVLRVLELLFTEAPP